MTKLYYTPPSDEIFDDLKQACIKLWQTMDNEYGYVNEKVNAIKDIGNVADNFMYMVAMFDMNNQRRLKTEIGLKPETVEAINERLIDGGSPEYLLL